MSSVQNFIIFILANNWNVLQGQCLSVARWQRLVSKRKKSPVQVATLGNPHHSFSIQNSSTSSCLQQRRPKTWQDIN